MTSLQALAISASTNSTSVNAEVISVTPRRPRPPTAANRSVQPIRLTRPRLQGAPMIHVSALRKQYGKRVAVEDLTFHVPTGRVTGFVGPNGAGKSTTIA